MSRPNDDNRNRGRRGISTSFLPYSKCFTLFRARSRCFLVLVDGQSEQKAIEIMHHQAAAALAVQAIVDHSDVNDQQKHDG
jgi:hypothetical protein